MKNEQDLEIMRQKLSDYGFVFFADVPVKTRSGQHLDTEMYLVDRTMQVQCNIRDISGRKQAEKEIVLKNEELRESV